MSYGIEVYNRDGVKTMGMEDFTYTEIFRTTVPQGNSNYNISVPGYNSATCVVLFTPITYVTGPQPGFGSVQGFVPGYQSPGGETVTVIRNSGGNSTAASLMQVFRLFGGN